MLRYSADSKNSRWMCFSGGDAVLGASHEQARRSTIDSGQHSHAILPGGIVVGVELGLERAAPLSQPVELIVIGGSDLGHVQQLLEHALVVAAG